jgi:hypothetical protein
MQINGDFQMFSVDDIKIDSSSRKTSASTHLDKLNVIQGGSLSTVLSQSLVSEDKDQLDWVLSQTDEALIDRTLLQLREQKTISLLFSHLLVKYQE